MLQNMNAGIIVYKQSKLPQLISMLATPKLDTSISLVDSDNMINIHIFSCPANKERLDRKSYKLLKEQVDKTKAKFLVERFETKMQSNVPIRKNETHYTELLPYIEAVKQLAVLIKMSQDKQENILSGNVGFIFGAIDRPKIDLLSEEASNIMLYDSPSLNEQLKTKLHNDMMERKGVSIVFTKDIAKIINNSSILSIDEAVDLSSYEHLLQDKVVLGNSCSKDIHSIERVILWNQELEDLSNKNPMVEYNNEIIAIFRYFNIKLDIIDFIRKLPYIYF